MGFIAELPLPSIQMFAVYSHKASLCFKSQERQQPMLFLCAVSQAENPWTMETSWVYYISILYQLQKLHQPFWLKKEHGKDLKKAVFSLHLLGKTWYMGERDRWRLHSVTGNRFWGFDDYDSTHNKYKGYSKIQSYNQWKSVSWHWERILYFALGKPENMQKYKEYILVIL